MPDRDFNPKDGGYTLIMNELIDKLAEFQLSSREHKLFWAIVRRTWSIKGQAWEELRWKYFTDKTGISSSHIGDLITRLKKRKILQVKSGKRWQQYKINSKVSQWLPLPEMGATTLKNGSAPENGSTPLPKTGVVPLPKMGVLPLKETYIKETSLKKERECSLPADFNLSLEGEKYALMKGIDIKKVDDFFDSFVNWAKAKGIQCVDWEAQFRIHCDNAPKFAKQYMAETKKKGGKGL